MGKLTKEDLERLRSVNHNREGYKTSKVTTRKGTHGSQTEHFSGRIDANVTPKAVPLMARKTGDR
jgi:hypothetical protein